MKVENVLWTGGWDSTYRILDLCLNKNREIQPYYILDSKGRKSTPVELETMKKIKKMIAECKPGNEALIRDHIFVEDNKIPKNEIITNNHKILVSQAHLGTQYDLLGRFAESSQVKDLNLCIHKDDKAEFFIQNDVELIEEANDRYWKLKAKLSQQPLSIFSYYKFPLLNFTKLEMQQKAIESGFLHIMEQTWFCSNPTKSGHPCGICNPCRYTREEGLGRRVPFPSLQARTRYKLGKIKRLIFK